MLDSQILAMLVVICKPNGGKYREISPAHVQVRVLCLSMHVLEAKPAIDTGLTRQARI